MGGTARLALALGLLGFIAQVTSLSSQRPYPRFDEVSYLSLTRDIQRQGGPRGLVRGLLDGSYTEDNRPPLYQLVLLPFVDDQPASFARAKLVNLAAALLLLAVVFLAVRRRFSPAVAVASVLLLCLDPTLADHAARVLHDVLYAAVTVGVVYAICSFQERGWAWWLGVGALIGIAYLTKGSGHLLFVPLVVAGLWQHRRRFLMRGAPYSALLGFVAVAGLLLWRNYLVFGAPLYNINGRELWIDRWEDVLNLSSTAEWSRVGLRWYLERHSVFHLLSRFVVGFGMVIGVACYTAGILFSALVPRVILGFALLALAGVGLVGRYRAGHRLEVVAVLATLGIYGAALSLAASGGVGAAERYELPYVALLVPYAADVILASVVPALSRRLAPRLARPGPALQAVMLVALAARLAYFAPGLAGDPRTYHGVSREWHETSLWLGSHLERGEHFAIAYQSYYSTWDYPFPDTDSRGICVFQMDRAALRQLFDQRHLRIALVDREDRDYALYRDKLSPDEDAHGPLALLDWPRCFADAGRPSRFLAYCRPR